MSESSANTSPKTTRAQTSSEPLPVVRSLVGGALMGMANLVPGVSGGTMIVITRLYDEFIESLADVTRLRFSRRNVAFLALVGFTAAIAIASLAGTLSRAVTLQRSAMFSLFIGMTLGGVPMLVRMIPRFNKRAVGGLLAGLAVMVLIAATSHEPPDKVAIKEAVAAGTFMVEPAYARDGVAGVLGMSAMVLPGISGAYMLLVLGRYETILAAIKLAKDFALSGAQEGDPAVFLRVLIPTAIGALISLIFLSNALKWLLHHQRSLTIGALLGILLGSVVGIWPFDAATTTMGYGIGAGLAGVGFVVTRLLSRISA